MCYINVRISVTLQRRQGDSVTDTHVTDTVSHNTGSSLLSSYNG